MSRDGHFFPHDFFDFYLSERCQGVTRSIFYDLVLRHFKVRFLAPVVPPRTRKKFFSSNISRSISFLCDFLRWLRISYLYFDWVEFCIGKTHFTTKWAVEPFSHILSYLNMKTLLFSFQNMPKRTEMFALFILNRFKSKDNR